MSKDKLVDKNGVPYPGSPQAIEQGCTCAVMDNHYGRGYSGPFGSSTPENPIFVITANCPLHGNDSNK